MQGHKEHDRICSHNNAFHDSNNQNVLTHHLRYNQVPHIVPSAPDIDFVQDCVS